MRPDDQHPKPTGNTTAPSQTHDDLSDGNHDSRYYSSFDDEPVGRPTQQYQPPYPAVPDPPKKRHTLRNTILISLGVIGLLVGASLFYVYNRRITVNELVVDTTQQTSYLRPSEWQPVHTDNLDGYGDMRAGDGKSTALVIVTKVPTYFPTLADGNEAEYDSIRQGLMEELNIELLAPAFKNISADCDASNTEFTKEPDTTKTETTTGLFKASATCGNSMLKVRGVAGNDGFVRIIGLMAPDNDWKLSSEAFQKILDSPSRAD